MRYFALTGSLLIQICLGGIYAWSAFVPALCGHYGLTTAQTQLIFGVSVAVFAGSMFLAGRMLDLWGPRVMATLGGLLFAGGYLTASVSRGQYGWLFLGLALMVGLGIGFAYVCPLSTCVRWFPRHKGLITGVAVGGFGAGAILQAAVVTALLERGMAALEIFRWIGMVQGAAVVAGAWMLVTPAATESDGVCASPRLLELLRDRTFQIPALGVFAGTFAGLLVIGNLKPLGLSAGVSVASAAVAISTFSAGNASGRVVWGWLADRLGIRVIPLSLLFLAATVLSLAFIAEFPWAFWLMAAMVGFGFGACFVVYAAHVATCFGIERFASVYPAVFLFYGFSGILGPLAGGTLFDRTGSYLPAIAVAVFVAAFGAWGCWRLIALREEESRPRRALVSSRYATPNPAQ